MAFYISPLVAIREIDLTSTIPAVMTSVACSIIRKAYKGSELKINVDTSTDELIRRYGIPTSVAANYYDMLTAAEYLRFGNQLLSTRVMPSGSTFAGTKAISGGTAGSTGATFTAYTTANAYKLKTIDGTSGLDDPDEFGSTTVSTQMAWIIAISRGTWGNKIRIAVMDKDTQDYIVENHGTDWESAGLPTYTTFESIDSPIAEDNELVIVVQALPQSITLANAVSTDWETVELFNVSLNESALDDEGRNKYIENVINEQSEYIRVALNDAYKNVSAITCNTDEWQVFAGGSDEDPDDATDDVTDALIELALDLYTNPEEQDVNIFIDSDKSETVKAYIDSICRNDRKDCMAILDCPYETVVNNRGNETSDLINWRKGLSPYTIDNLNFSSSYSAVYGNWVEIYDKWNQKYRWIPVSGHIAAVFAKTDLMTEAWFAPGGLNRGILDNVRRLGWNPSLGNRDLLYKNGINPICSFVNKGKVVWGQKTLLDKSSAFNRINVRRLFLTLEKAISTAAVYILFEQNTEYTRNRMLNMINPYLKDVQGRQGIYSYSVICDSSNNTPERIDRNELWCDIYIQPVKAAEFIILSFIATKTGASFVEATVSS